MRVKFRRFLKRQISETEKRWVLDYEEKGLISDADIIVGSDVETCEDEEDLKIFKRDGGILVLSTKGEADIVWTVENI